MIATELTIAGMVVQIVILGLVACVYFLPSIVAWRRHVVNVGSVVVVNVLLGWTFIGWVVALAMALRTAKTTPA